MKLYCFVIESFCFISYNILFICENHLEINQKYLSTYIKILCKISFKLLNRSECYCYLHDFVIVSRNFL